MKSWAVEVVREHVYHSDWERPRQRPDRDGFYHYKDRKIRIACAPSPRGGWGNCMVRVEVARRGRLFHRFELVLATGYAADVSVFRPGMWIDYLAGLAREIETVGREREAGLSRQREEEERRHLESRFGPVDDSKTFKKD